MLRCSVEAGESSAESVKRLCRKKMTPRVQESTLLLLCVQTWTDPSSSSDADATIAAAAAEAAAAVVVVVAVSGCSVAAGAPS